MAPRLPPPNPQCPALHQLPADHLRSIPYSGVSLIPIGKADEVKKKMLLQPPLLPKPTPPDEQEVADILCALPILVRARDPRRLGCAAYLVAGESHWLAKRCRSLPPLSDPVERLRIYERRGDNTERVLVATLAEEKIGPVRATATEAAEHSQPQNLLLQRHQAPALEPAQTFIASQQQSRQACEAASREARKRRDNLLREKRAKKSRFLCT